MIRILSIVLLFTLCLTASAQISRGGEPHAWSKKNVNIDLIPSFTLSPVDVEALRSEDERFDREKSSPFRFGSTEEVDIDILEEAVTDILLDGTTIYRYAIHSPGALTLSFLLNNFYIPEGGELFLWNKQRNDFLGSYTHENNKAGGMFPIGLLEGETVVFEYHLAPNAESTSSLHLLEVTHGYRTILNKWAARGPFGNSGECNINVMCPLGQPYLDQMRSVALIVNGNSAICSGAMIANTEMDDTPYFLTANHCLNSPGDPSSWLYYFQHQSPTCSGSCGPTNMSVATAETLFNSSSSDVLLLRLSETPPANFDLFYAGWNSSTSNNVTSSAYSIHHPSGDVKKICFEEDSPFFASINSTATWRIEEWEDGVTEGGSSGAPLFDNNDLIIGQLFGGQAACVGDVNNGQFDVYGRFGVSYPNLQQWLDPMGTDSLTKTGYYPFGAPPPPPPVDSLELDVYLSPTLNNGFFRIILNEVKDAEVTVFNVLGAPIYTESVRGQTVYPIDLRDIGNYGIYLVRIETDEGTFVERMVYDRE